MKGLMLYLLVVLVLHSCKITPSEINYGVDQCSFCSMNIVDKAHACQLVTQKGKQYKYDAIECLLKDKQSFENQDFAYLLVADYNNPGTRIDAINAVYLVSPGIASPMGANLSAFSDANKANEAQELFGGQIFTWNQIEKKF